MMQLKTWLLILFVMPLFARAQHKYDAVYSGVPWFDDKGNVVSAHGANIVKDNGRYYLFGERHDDTSNAFVGFNCYSSTDLYNWKFESIALPQQPSGKLGANRVGERCKVMKCPSTGKYMMYMHVDTLGYKDQFVGYAISKNIVGPYHFQGPLLYDGKPIRKWDMGTFQDVDGSGYVLLHGGDIYKLDDDYKSIKEQTCKAFEKGFESPAIFKKDSIYFFLGSDLTGWERNDNYYFTSTSLNGPWTKRGLFAPQGTLTWNSQTTFVLPIQGSRATTYMFMGDRWSFPKQASAATYVWQPLTVSGTSLSIPQYWGAWTINQKSGEVQPRYIGEKIIDNFNREAVTWSGAWRLDTLSTKTSDTKGDAFAIKFRGTQIGLYSLARPDGGYAQVVLKNSKGKTVLSTAVDMYCKYPSLTLKFLSPLLPKDDYTLTVSVAGERWWWKEKSGRVSGSTGNLVSIAKAAVTE